MVDDHKRQVVSRILVKPNNPSAESDGATAAHLRPPRSYVHQSVTILRVGHIGTLFHPLFRSPKINIRGDAYRW